MLKQIRRATLRLLRGSGVFGLVLNSRWRSQRILILCYHGISQEDEHLWRPSLYMQPSLLQERLELLRSGGYNVLPLGEGLRRLQTGELPPRSVAITFDDGGFDFYKRAYPVLKSYGFPVTVYQSTYHSDHSTPIFNLICSYMLWKRRNVPLDKGAEMGLDPPMDLSTETSRRRVVQKLVVRSEAENLTGAQKNELAAELAGLLGIDYEELLSKRILQLMNPTEIAELAADGVDFQLHTHRHRTPSDEPSFRKEIQDNRRRIEEITSVRPLHFCYPSGVYEAQFLPWLQAEEIASATTCENGLATPQTNPLLLPRFVDTSAKSAVEFESWMTGLGSWLAPLQTALQSPQRD
jgi:peptidoglycan/xylan/chitin deacetylase (PgdA/CDA1 family)